MKVKALLINDTNLVCHHGCSLLMNQIYKTFKENNILIKDTLYHEYNFDNFKINHKKNYDMALINGEGTIHGSTNKVSQIFNLISKLKKKNIPVIIFNSTIADLSKKNINILKLVNKIYVRENESYKYLKKNKINSRVVPDFLSLLPMCIKERKNLKTLIVDSSVRSTTKKLLRFSKKRGFAYAPMLYTDKIKLLHYLFIKIFLIFNINILQNLFIILKNKNAEKYKNTIQQSKFLITGRFHSIFFALSSLTPFVTFDSDTHKTKALLKDIGIEDRLISIDQLNNIKTKNQNFSKLEINKILKYKRLSKISIKQSMGEIIKVSLEKYDK